MQLLTNPAFIAKNRLPAVAKHVINLRPLRDQASEAEVCRQDPVRALKTYLRKSNHTVEGGPACCCPYPATGRTFGADNIVLAAGNYSVGVSRPLHGAGEEAADRAHEIRAFATSLAFVRNYAVKDFIAAVGWRTDSTLLAST